MPSQPRVIALDSPRAAADMFRDLGQPGEERRWWAARALGEVIRINDLPLDAATQLVSALRDAGGDGLAVAAGQQADAALFGSAEQMAAAVLRLRQAGGAAARWAKDIEAALRAFYGPPPALEVNGRRLDWSKRAYVDAVINVTPDSFYDGGRHNGVEGAVDYALRTVEDGADILEIGGESAGPGKQVGAQEEIDRTAPVVEALVRRTDVPLSIDTNKYEVAAAAVAAGAHIVNDTQNLSDPRMLQLVAERQTALVLMHFPGEPGEKPRRFHYRDVMDHVCTFLRERADLARKAGVPRSHIIIDPGIGFHKTDAHDLEVLRRLSEMKSLGYPIMLGSSNRGVLGWATGLPLGERVEATAATVAFGIAQGAHILRVHNVKEMSRVVHTMAAIFTGRPSYVKHPHPDWVLPQYREQTGSGAAR
ncbi:MAG: dihydropteroate synthase [Chloroflexi bacterium]|nr:dihydropteroate synthase [Chloroflexota bacterium]